MNQLLNFSKAAPVIRSGSAGAARMPPKRVSLVNDLKTTLMKQ